MTIVEKQAILTTKNERKHEVRTDPDDPDMVMEVWVRDISFLDVQKATQTMFHMVDGDIVLDLQGYWSYAFTNWVVRTNPELSPAEMLELSAHAGEQIASLLPKPEEVAEAMQGGFTKANS